MPDMDPTDQAVQMDVLRALLQEAAMGLQHKLRRRTNSYRLSVPLMPPPVDYSLTLYAYRYEQELWLSLWDLGSDQQDWDQAATWAKPHRIDLCDPASSDQLRQLLLRLVVAEAERRKGLILAEIQELRQLIRLRRKQWQRILRHQEVMLVPLRALDPAKSGTLPQKGQQP